MDNSEIKRELFLTTKKIKKLIYHHSHNHLNHSEFMILKLLSDWCCEKQGSIEGIKMSDLAEKMRVSRPAISKLINSLEEKGDIVRIFGKEDKRTTFIQLTDQGKKRNKEWMKRMDERMERLVVKMGEEDSIELVRLLNKFYNIMESEMSSTDEKENKGCK